MSTNGVAQVLLVSKAHMQSVKQLYKMIFRLHKSLPPDMKELGDKYVRNEFKLHKTASPEHTKVFLNEWAVSKVKSIYSIGPFIDYTYCKSKLHTNI